MKRQCRTRARARWILAGALLGVPLLLAQAHGQDYRGYARHRNPRLYAGDDLHRPDYESVGHSTPYELRTRRQSGSAQARPAGTASRRSWKSHTDRVAQLEAQLASLRDNQDNRVAELEAEIGALTERLETSGEMLAPHGSAPCGGCGMCGECDPCCPPVQRGFYTGVDFLLLKPYFGNSVAFLSSSDGNIANRSNARSHEFDHDLEFAPRVFLGYHGDSGLGVRTRYFQFDHDSNQPAFDIPAGGDAETPAIDPQLGSGQHFFMDDGGADVFRASSSLELHTWDLEATNQFTFCKSVVVGAAGVRYMNMEQSYRADAVHSNGHLQESLFNRRDFEGAGPTLALDLLRPISCCSGLAFYANARGSALFGDTDQVFRKVDGTTGAVTESFVRNEADDTIYIGELGLGLQYTRGILFGRAGWEAQYWSNAGSPTSNEGDFALQGLNVTAGLNY